jgi:CRISPR/Cas system endoribonuclease Cas6 (RAMP superfamily)
MMVHTITDKIRTDITNFLENSDHLPKDFKRELLENLIEKYIQITLKEVVLSKKDFDTIVGEAKNSYSRNPIPNSLCGASITENEVVNLMIIEATFGVLNEKGILKQMPKFKGR